MIGGDGRARRTCVLFLLLVFYCLYCGSVYLCVVCCMCYVNIFCYLFV